MRILVVDDSNPHRRMLTAVFGGAGHEVLTAPDGEAALTLLPQSLRDAEAWWALPELFEMSAMMGNQGPDEPHRGLQAVQRAAGQRVDILSAHLGGNRA